MTVTLTLPGPFWLIGCGNMAGAMLEGWLACGLDPARVTVIRPSGRAVAPGVRVLTTYPEDEVPALVMLGMKPQMLDEVAPGLAPILDSETILISILAGVEQASLRARFARPWTIVKAMPNTPVRLNKGVIGLFSDSGDTAAREMVERLMAALGLAEWFEDEDVYNIVTSLAGSGPAYLFRFIDALAAAGERLGVPADQARRLAVATAEGTGALAAASAESPAQLADHVASPGGSTRAGLDVLDEGGALSELIFRTLDASRRRSLEMAAAARASRG